MNGLWFRTALLPEGWTGNVRLVLADGMIVSAESGARPEPEDERHAIGLPGLPNVHSHAFQRAMAGTAERRGAEGEDFWTWRAAMYRLAQHIGPDELEAIAALAFAEMLEAGFTRVGEFHYLHHAPDGSPYADVGQMASRIAAAAEASGIGLTLLPVFYAHSGFGGAPPAPEQRRFVCGLDLYERLLDASRAALTPIADAVVGVAPHSLRAATSEELTSVASLAGANPIHIHLAEQLREVEECVAWSGRRPVEQLLDHADVDGRWCAVHATHMTSEETQRLAASGAVAGLCPITEANLGDGKFPAAEFLAQGGAFGIGSDSNVLIDAPEELRLLEYGQRLTRLERNVLAGPGEAVADRLFGGALAGGSRALGVEPDRLAPGAPASFVSLNGDHPSLDHCPPDQILSRWIFAARGGAVDCVWRRGRKLVSGGRHVARTSLLERYRAALGRLPG
jgi:formiminoglutamate deiminase